MKHPHLLILATVCLEAISSNACFNDEAVQDMIAKSAKMDRCFSTPKIGCALLALPQSAQREASAHRLVPMDRMAAGHLMNDAVGLVSVTYPQYGGRYSEKTGVATGQRISRCHVITSAHTLFRDGTFPIARAKDATIKFHVGQTCNPKQPFAETIDAEVVFTMLEQGQDFRCEKDFDELCATRLIAGRSDIMILKLHRTRAVTDYFLLDTSDRTFDLDDTLMNCWGFPGHDPTNPRTSAFAPFVYLWGQKDARLIASRGVVFDEGVPTTATAYKGMSGGGCVTQNRPNTLIALYSKDNSGSGESELAMRVEEAYGKNANFLSTFYYLDKRYAAAHPGKRLREIESECD